MQENKRKPLKFSLQRLLQFVFFETDYENN